MGTEAERTRPLWMQGIDLPRRPPLDADAAADVVVVGAGIAGLTTAYLLAKGGRRVIVLDSGQLGAGMTARTTAHLACALDDRWSELIRLRGVEDARLAAESHAAAIDRIEAIAAEGRIACDFARLDGWLFRAPEDPADILDRELEAARSVGLDGVEIAEAPVAKLGRALRFPRQGRFHPMKYVAGLVHPIEQAGGRVCAGSMVASVHGKGGSVTVTTSTGRHVRARYAVVATNTPINDRIVTHTKQAPYRTYVVTLRVAKGSVPDALYWDTPDPYHYLRLQPGAAEGGDDLLIVGGEDHKTGQANDGAERLDRLEAWARERFPVSGGPVHSWSGQVMEPIDFLAFIGRNPGEDEVFIATGDSGRGMTHGTIAGMLISDLILGRPNRWERLYAIGRITPRAATDFAKENLNVAARLATDYLSGGDAPSADVLKPGEGAILRRGLRKIAAYRDASGVLHERSAICPHMGCIVAWNALEGCWDCPCHGSQFAPEDGRPLSGPAASGLARVR